MNLPIKQRTFVRLAIMAVGGLLFALLVPLQGESVVESGRVPAALFVAAIGFVFIHQGLERRRQLHATVALELNKLRRIYHIAKNISLADERCRPWFTEIHGHLLAYLGSFRDKTFGQYEDSNALFRRLSYHVYTVPGIESAKEQALYTDLLKTTAVIAEARQRLVEFRDNRLSAYSWTVFLLAVLGNVIVILESTPDRLADRLVAGVIMILGLLVVDLLWEVDTLENEAVEFPQRYVENAAKLELRREE